MRATTESFIKKAELIHGQRYDYSAVDYVSSLDKVIIRCLEHGEFFIVPAEHSRGKGCPPCAWKARSLLHCHNTEQFIELASARHAGKYSYECSVFVQDMRKVDVTCKEHGIFSVLPRSHKQGQGCPRCAKSGYKRHDTGSLYVLSAGDVIKVGITNRAAKLRLQSIRCDSGIDFKLRVEIRGNGQVAYDTEQASLKWLRSVAIPVTKIFDGSTECFTGISVDDVLDYVFTEYRNK